MRSFVPVSAQPGVWFAHKRDVLYSAVALYQYYALPALPCSRVHSIAPTSLSLMDKIPDGGSLSALPRRCLPLFAQLAQTFFRGVCLSQTHCVKLVKLISPFSLRSAWKFKKKKTQKTKLLSLRTGGICRRVFVLTSLSVTFSLRCCCSAQICTACSHVPSR